MQFHGTVDGYLLVRMSKRDLSDLREAYNIAIDLIQKNAANDSDDMARVKRLEETLMFLVDLQPQVTAAH